LNIICTYRNLAHEFNVSTGTIRRDIVVLTCSYPIETVKGSHGGVRVAEWFHLDRRMLNAEEIALLCRLGESLDGMTAKSSTGLSPRFRIEGNRYACENQRNQNQSRAA
jgi:predicted DNA-binding transcriptional regulator YafY